MYKIEEESFTGAVARLVEQFKVENPSVGEFFCTCHDGTTVAIKIEAEKPKARKKKVPAAQGTA